MWSKSSVVILAMALLASTGAQPVSQMEMEPMLTTVATSSRSKLVIEELEPMRIHFVTEHRPTSLGQNYYLKPGEVVGSVALDSGHLQVRHDQDDGKPVASKHNILFVAYAKDLAQKSRQRE
ncbi:uncharacterized protein LOC6524698 [Drosophila yakuba]|uniref:Uncharacterized protein n=1 Tax=Drosophila yakuba TaxID=7245 RepID=B4Q2Q6_DROYA|nr:uncharacterized protein LOC6524698 [Drosophila yakuba]EDX01650.1 uncharacterized protein Dyak_GE17122 [Drosophila yakuba]